MVLSSKYKGLLFYKILFLVFINRRTHVINLSGMQEGYFFSHQQSFLWSPRRLGIRLLAHISTIAWFGGFSTYMQRRFWSTIKLKVYELLTSVNVGQALYFVQLFDFVGKIYNNLLPKLFVACLSHWDYCKCREWYICAQSHKPSWRVGMLVNH